MLIDTTDETTREILAEYMHDLWCYWATELMESEKLSRERRTRWKKCLIPYENLSRKNQNKDLKVVYDMFEVVRTGLLEIQERNEIEAEVRTHNELFGETGEG